MELDDLEVYQIAREIGRLAWNVYKDLKNEYRFSTGQQFLESVGSIGANIAEGFGRYHYLDSAKFYYNARGSLWEAKHWTETLHERDLMSEEIFETISKKYTILAVKLNNFIASTKSKVSK